MTFSRFLKLALVLATVTVTAAGCSSRYVMTTTNGSKIITSRKPKLVDAKYVYKDGSGRTNEIPAMRVRVIEPYSKKAVSGGTMTIPELK